MSFDLDAYVKERDAKVAILVPKIESSHSVQIMILIMLTVSSFLYFTLQRGLI